MEKQASAARRAVRLLYGFAGLLLIMRLLTLSPIYESASPLWPLAWTGWLPADVATPVLRGVLLLGAVACFLPTCRSFRIVAAGSYLLVTAWGSSFGKVNHNDHMMLWTLVVFVAVPTAAMRPDARRRDQLSLLIGFARAQTLVLFFYTMAGILKLIGGVVQAAMQEPNLFRLDAMPRQIAARLLQTNDASWLGDWLINHPLVATPLLWGAVYLEAASVWIAWRPSLHRVWGAALIAMHIGIGLAMTIWFDATFPVLLCLLVLSPFAKPAGAGAMLADLPGIGWLLRKREDTR